jgi:hypothetical protein
MVQIAKNREDTKLKGFTVDPGINPEAHLFGINLEYTADTFIE